MPNSIGSARLYPSQSPRREVVALHVRLVSAAGTSWAIVEGQGVVSVDDVGTGVFRLNLSQPYHRLLGASFVPVLATRSSVTYQVVEESALGSASAPHLEIGTFSAAAAYAAADPAAGDIVCITLYLSQSPLKA